MGLFQSQRPFFAVGSVPAKAYFCRTSNFRSLVAKWTATVFELRCLGLLEAKTRRLQSDKLNLNRNVERCWWMQKPIWPQWMRKWAVGRLVNGIFQTFYVPFKCFWRPFYLCGLKQNYCLYTFAKHFPCTQPACSRAHFSTAWTWRQCSHMILEEITLHFSSDNPA